MMKLSIIIPTYNRYALLAKNLSLLNQYAPGTYELDIHIVDDCSSFSVKKKNQALCKRYNCAYHFSPVHKGPAHARNKGIAACSGEWVTFLDDDVCINFDWYERLEEAISDAKPQVVGIEGVTRTLGNGLWDKEVENLHGGLFLTCNIVYRRKVLIPLGGFDEAFTGPFAEDQELALRIKRMGTIIFAQNLIVFHLPRKVNPCSYLANSFSRMRSLLDAEFHFYNKHKDRYHTCRYASSFWHGLGNILLKHTIISLRRRSLNVCLGHPLQTFILILSGLCEQIAAWLLVPRYLNLFYHTTKTNHLHQIARKKTAKLWQFDREIDLDLLMFKPSLLKPLLFRLNKRPVYNCLTILPHISKVTQAPCTRIFIRIDDVFLSKYELIEQFIKAMKQGGISFVAAIPGNDLRRPENVPIIENIVEAGGSIGLHGYSHRGKYGPYPSEILQMNFPELKELNESIKQAHLPVTCKPKIFIPPFNAISWEQIIYLGETYQIICGGPETARFTSYRYGPLVLENNALYFPSFFPLYGQAADMLDPGLKQKIFMARAPLCCTFHLQNEAQDGFSSLIKYIYKNHSIISDWNELLS